MFACGHQHSDAVLRRLLDNLRVERLFDLFYERRQYVDDSVVLCPRSRTEKRTEAGRRRHTEDDRKIAGRQRLQG